MSDMKMYTVDKFLGINEAADGYTELKMGEASKMVNWMITDGFNLKTRPGIQRIDFSHEREAAPILAAWAGNVGEQEYLVVADYLDQDRIFLYAKDAERKYYLQYTQVGALGLAAAENGMVKIFTFAGKLYIMSAVKTVVYDNGAFADAAVYVPLVITGAAPSGGGAVLENLNLLSPLRRIDYSADGEATEYVLPEEAIKVTRLLIDNVETEGAGTFDPETHTYKFDTAPIKGVGNVEFTYTTDPVQAEENRLRIAKMRLWETFNGSTDTRLFLAGDGTNVCFYSGVPQSGDLTQLYFPAMNEARADMSASPITGIVRHYSSLVIFKPDGAYTLTYEPVTLADGNVIAGFYMRPANREFGNEVMGQIQTVNNYPRTVCSGGIYEWRITSSYYKDERNALRISAAVEKTLNSVDPARLVTCDDNANKTYYVFLNDEEGTVLVNRYALTKDGIWCIYKSSLCTNVKHAMMHDGTMAFVTDKDLFFFSEDAAVDAPVKEGQDSQQIIAVWESGYMSFGVDFRRKYSSEIYVSMLPESSSGMIITASTDKRDSYMEKSAGQSVFSFAPLDFAHFSFNLSRTPKIQRVRLKVKKFVYHKLIFKVNSIGNRATVLGYDQRVRFSSMAK